MSARGDPRPFAALTPDAVLDAAEAAGLEPDGHVFALNSYENRVYRLGRADAPPVVVKFYRAGRWSDQQILEEHQFAAELAAAEIPVVAPLRLGDATLYHGPGVRMAAFPLQPGGAPDLDQPEARELLGRTLGRIHAIGALRSFTHRPSLAGERLGARARAAVLASGQLPQHMRAGYARISAELLAHIDAADVAGWRPIRLHGDCHLGNILWQSAGPVFVDLDDCLNGPAVQDLWMFLAGNPDERRRQWSELLAGYERFASFDHSQLRLVEVLRAVRMLNHAAWIAERWADPAFPRAFPWFGEARFWEQHVNDLAEQASVLYGGS
ncbi:MAG: serine/threonine protein kinase [Gammaproteobacteria bacterium]|nr:serine/threonine protein kinase [Gammaproteobacteria bacterium]MDE2250923.1 serine/threonine protein kinase [Gammaproteobacteria bacterium]